MPGFFVWCSMARNIDRMFLCDPTTSCLHFCTLALDIFVDTFRMYPCNLHTSGSQHEIFWQTSSIYIGPESSSIFEDFIIFKRDFGYWACHLVNCIQLIILFELFTKSLHCNHFGSTCSATWSALRDSSNFFPTCPSRARHNSSAKLLLFSNYL